jgi:hypothetical protein
MRSYAASILLLYIAASSLKTWRLARTHTLLEKPYTADSRLTLERAQPFSSSYTVNFMTANSKGATGTLLPMSAHYGTYQTLAHTLRENAPRHKALTTTRHNVACQLTHAAIQNSSKGVGGLHRSPDLVLVTVDAGSRKQTSQVSLEALCPSQSTEENARGNLCPSLYPLCKGFFLVY